MADNTKLETRSPPSISQPAPTSPVNPLKRKEPPGPSESEQKPFSPPSASPAGVTDTHQGEYEKGRITCKVCGTGVGFRDAETGDFTLKHWEAHRLTCSMSGQSSIDPVYNPESTAEALAHPPAKRRREKCAEERIDYLRADPYVAQFEAYRVLCASCNNWIWLGLNSTYCPVSWDAHRKSCLTKQVNSKNVYALEERNALFSKDPDIRKFDAERVLCSICDKWLSVNPDDHLQAVQIWLQHRAVCQKDPTLPPNQPTLTEPISAPPLTEYQAALAIVPERGPSFLEVQPLSPHLANPIYPKPELGFAQRNEEQPHDYTSGNSSFHDYNTSNYAHAHESPRRNTQQRAAALRAGSLIHEVEPNRVFCRLCQKWVQLRQDSSYWAYPWLQHRGTCLASTSGQPAVGSEQQPPTITIDNPLAVADIYNEWIAQEMSESGAGLAATNCHMPLYIVGNSDTPTGTYDPELQAFLRNNVQPSYHPDHPAVDTTAQSSKLVVEVPTSTDYVTDDENINSSTFTNAHLSHGISKNLAVASHLMPGYSVGNSHTFTGTHNPEPQTLASSGNNMQQSYYPGIPTVGSFVQPPTWHCSNFRHVGSREHKCQYCGKNFVRKDTLTRHVKTTRCWLRRR